MNSYYNYIGLGSGKYERCNIFCLYIIMLSKQEKLTGKEINYMLKRGKRYYGEYFIFRVIPQYANKQYDQWAFQIPLKIDKRATMRNLLKRISYAYVWSHTKNTKKYYKIFASVNKKQANHLKELIATTDKNTIVKTRESFIEKEIRFLFWKL